MFALLIIIAFGIVFSLLATQNTMPVPLRLFNYQFINIPLYLVALGSLLVGVILSWGLSLVGWLSNSFMLAGKNNDIRKYENEIIRLQRVIKNLQTENAKLHSDKEDIREEKRAAENNIKERYTKPNILDRFRHGFSG